MLNHIKAKGKLYRCWCNCALVQYNKSLLPVGIVKIDGRFDRGDLVVCMTEKGVEVARGLINYSSLRLKKFQGCFRSRSKRTWVYGRAEVIHKDNLILISSSFEDSKLSEQLQ